MKISKVQRNTSTIYFLATFSIFWTFSACLTDELCFEADCDLVEQTQALRQDYGQWGPLVDWGILPIHAAITPNKKVITYGQRAVDYVMWDPELGDGIQLQEKVARHSSAYPVKIV